MGTSIPVLDNDLERFKRFKLKRQYEIGEELSHEEFFTLLLNEYEKKNMG